jgi:hypothetical protein
MACDSYKALLSSHVDGELPPDQGRLLKDHLPGCDSCRRTIRFLRMEDDAIRGALLAGHRGEPIRLGSSRALRAALIGGIFVGLSLVALYVAYRGIAGNSVAARDDTFRLDQPVHLRAERLPVAKLVEEIAHSAGTDIRIVDPAALADRPPATVVLVEPIRLGSVLELLGEFYGLTPRIRDEIIYLE